jgi:hypothetical protein
MQGIRKESYEGWANMHTMSCTSGHAWPATTTAQPMHQWRTLADAVTGVGTGAGTPWTPAAGVAGALEPRAWTRAAAEACRGSHKKFLNDRQFNGLHSRTHQKHHLVE